MALKRRIWLLVLLATLLPTLTSCLYLNTLFNGRKAWKEAEQSRDTRFRKNPSDTVEVASDEEAQYRRAIAKGSKVLEMWPKDTSWHPEALILIARSQQRLGEFTPASRTFLEIIDNHPDSRHWQSALQGRIECLLSLGLYSEAEEWMRRLDSTKAEGGPAGLAWLRARLALGRLDTATARGELWTLLSMRNVPVPRRTEAAWLLGNLEWNQRAWRQARISFTRPEMERLPRPRRYRAHLLAGIALDRADHPDSAVAELQALSNNSLYDVFSAETILEIGRIQLARGWFTQAMKELARLETMTQPADKVAEGLVLLGDDARMRRVDYPEALRLYELAARVGAGTEMGALAQKLASAMAALKDKRKETVTDSTRVNWNFSLAEIFLFDLSNADSARAAYRRVGLDTMASRTEKARAAYALAWIDASFRPDSLEEDPAVWSAVAKAWPGTEFAKQAQINAGEPITVVTREDSAEVRFRTAERRWLDNQDPVGAIAQHEALYKEYGDTKAGKRALYAIAWLHDKERADSALAAKAYQKVVDSLPGTEYARRAQMVLDGEPDAAEESGGLDNGSDGGGEEGAERMDGRKFGPRKPADPQLESPDEPEAIPPALEDQLLQPDDFE